MKKINFKNITLKQLAAIISEKLKEYNMGASVLERYTIYR